MAKLREQPARAQDNRIAAVLQSQYETTLEQRNSMAEWRKLNEIAWDDWANDFPAYVKQRHYSRGLNAVVVWSANDIACASHGQQ
eukprot:3401805-Pyramimonas_sp.AAC.1